MTKAKWSKLPRYLIPLFNSANIYLCRTRDEWLMAESALEISHVDVKFNNGIVRHVTNDATGENLYLVGVFDNSVGTLVHECAHAAFYVCDDVGVRVETRQRNETFCYLLDRMFSHFHQYIPQKEIK